MHAVILPVLYVSVCVTARTPPEEEEEDEHISTFSFFFQSVLFGFNKNVRS
jgi:hypothetical protein